VLLIVPAFARPVPMDTTNLAMLVQLNHVLLLVMLPILTKQLPKVLLEPQPKL